MLNIILDRPVTMFSKNTPLHATGHLYLDKDIGGYRLYEIADTDGNVVSWSSRLHAKEMDHFIDGTLNGISLRNAHIGAMLLKNEVEKVGLTPDASLYGTANVVLLHSTKDGV